MNPVRLFFFQLYLTITDVISKGYDYVGKTLSGLIHKCFHKSINYQDSIEVLDVSRLESSRIFVKSDYPVQY